MNGSLPQDAAARKAAPMAEGLLWYFPNALAAVAAVSKAGNDQHNPGEPMHHARGKSMDHADCIMRHLVDAGTIDTDGQRHSAKVAWRALALLQEEIEREDGVPLPRNAKGSPSNNARKLYDETSAVAAAQDAALYAVADIPETSPVADIDWNACFPTRAQLDAAATGKPPLEPSRICTPAELAYLASFGPNERVPPRDDAPPMSATLRDVPTTFTDSHGNGITRRVASRHAWDEVGGTFVRTQPMHPMYAEAMRIDDERTPEDRL